ITAPLETWASIGIRVGSARRVPARECAGRVCAKDAWRMGQRHGWRGRARERSGSRRPTLLCRLDAVDPPVRGEHVDLAGRVLAEREDATRPAGDELAPVGGGRAVVAEAADPAG